MASPPPNTKDGKLGRVCVCGNHISEKDTDLTCNECLGLRHAREAPAPMATAGASTDWGERMEQEDLRAMTDSKCLEGCDAHDELDSVDGSDDAVLFEEDGADSFQPVEEVGLRRTQRDQSTEGARGDDDSSPTIGTSLHDVCRRSACHQAGNPMAQRYARKDRFRRQAFTPGEKRGETTSPLIPRVCGRGYPHLVAAILIEEPRWNA
ncbi:unnamed protein product [Arctogadus glacialis]